ncbi:hypothetical protein BH20ACT1_BH20ACT1_13100 [soil metagenome]
MSRVLPAASYRGTLSANFNHINHISNNHIASHVSKMASRAWPT